VVAVRHKNSRLLHRYSMDTTYTQFILRKHLPQGGVAVLSEISEYFPRQEINAMFQNEIQTLLDRQHLYQLDATALSELKELRTFDLVAYLDSALRRAGFKDPDLDLHVQDLVVKLLLGSLFSGFRGGSLKARLLVAVKNAISTLLMKQRKNRTRSRDLPLDVQARSQEPDIVVDVFRNYLRSHLGPAAVVVLDQRLDGGDTKDLIGQQGLETSYAVKKVVARIKQALQTFAGQDSEFHAKVVKALEVEAGTIRRRFPMG
jgi:hypothetical protein